MGTTRTRSRVGALVTCALLLTAFAAESHARDLSFAQRLAAQEAIEKVYWSHRIWPGANPGPKPPLAKVLPEAALRAKLARRMRLMMAVDAARGASPTGADLQAEIDRMAASTKAPDTLRELFAALGDDPFLIAECLARPAVTDRLAAAAGMGIGLDASELELPAIAPPALGYRIPVIPDGGCTNDSWAISSLTNGSGARVPSARQLHTALSTGAELIIWGGSDGGSGAFNDGGVYEPAIDAWLISALTSPTGANVPSARYRHTAVWTGTEMIIWGGRNAAGNALKNGGRYSIISDSWAPSSLVNASGTNVPAARQRHTAVWTGTTMIVWGGTPDTPANGLNTGGVFDPAVDGWLVSSLANGSGAFTPAARSDHTAVWTGTEMIVWGGSNAAGNDLDNGGLYNPATDAWASSRLNTGGGTLVPSPRHNHTAVWTGEAMIIWGGSSAGASVDTGGIYSRTADSWLSSSLKNGGGTRVPTARQLHTAVWTGGEMIVWGGSTDGNTATLNTGGRYSPVDDAWAVSDLTNAAGARVPTARQYHTANWDPGSLQMLIWGGTSGAPDGGLYCATCPLAAWHADADGDGYGNPTATSASCLQPAGYVANALDCDDTNPNIHPGAAEICDGIDEDCDSVADNGGDALCNDGAACTADVCQGLAGCAAATANFDTTGFSATRVDGRDLVVFANAYGSCPGDTLYNAAANLDQSATPPNDCIDANDFHLFMNTFGLTCP